MYIVIIGDGKVGRTITKHLSQEGHDIVIIDKNPNIIDEAVNEFDVKGIYGNGASYDIQKEAGVNKADLVIAVTSGDELNILCCLVAKKLGAKQTIARVRNPEYSKQILMMRDELGLSMTVNPELEAAREISRMLRFPCAIKVDTFANGKVDLVELKVDEKSNLVGLKLQSLRTKYQIHVLVCAVLRNNEVVIPRGDFVFEAKDKLYITSNPQQITKFFKCFNIIKEKPKNAIIIGGGKIAYYLIPKMIDSNIGIKVIEIDKKKCVELSEAFPEITVINGDGTNQKLLLEEGIESTDSILTLTGYDEENIIISMYAKNKNVAKVITKINRENYNFMLENVGLDSLISPKEITANNIIRYARGMESSMGSEFRTLYKLVENKVEALEFFIATKTQYTSIPLKNLEVKSDILIASIIRDGVVIIPSGDDTIEALDTVIIITTKRQLKDLSEIIK